MHNSLRVFCCCIFSVSCANAQSDAVFSLKGLNGVAVVIEPLDSEAAQTGLTVDTLRADVELPLRRSGVKVLNLGDLGATNGYPMLRLRVIVNCVNSGNAAGICAYAMLLRLQQAARLERDKQEPAGMATTWELEMLGTGGISKASSGVREGLRTLTDHFLNDYLTVNPK
jgi:hypothetical protein